jgi:type I restriction-modification system DNA methylase subunit
MSKDLIQKLNEAAKRIESASTKEPAANYIIADKSIGDILKRQFYRTDRIMKIEKILKNYE